METWPDGCVDLAFADPPYNIGYIYDNYRDDRPDADYVSWCRSWMAQIHRLLTPTGSFYLAIGDDFAADLRIVGRELGYGLRNWIIWSYTFGQNSRSKFGRAHTHILYFVKDPKNQTFNDHLLRYPSARHTEYQDLRASPQGRVPDDVWDEFPRVCGTFRERDGYHGCQLPEGLLTRIILASSREGEVVLDPFVGSGTTAAVAKRLGRRYLGIDMSEEYVARTRKRVDAERNVLREPANAAQWPDYHHDTLMQIYRETKVLVEYLVDNEVALRVIAGSLEARTNAAYSLDEIREALLAARAGNRLPKLPNDRPFTKRNHVKEGGKKYTRTVARQRPRSTAAPLYEAV